MKTYDSIIKRGSSYLCDGCIGSGGRDDCRAWKEELRTKKRSCGVLNTYYANKDQIEGLIKEALNAPKITESEYSKGKKFLKEKAAEMINEKEYVVIKHNTLDTLSMSNIPDGVFRELFMQDDYVCAVGEVITKNDSIFFYSEHLLAAGFIEDFEDFMVRPGDAFKFNDTIYQVIEANVGELRMISMSYYRPFNCYLSYKGSCCKLSDLIGTEYLNEFNRCYIEIKEK